MTVGELIKQLRTFPENIPIYVNDKNDDSQEITCIQRKTSPAETDVQDDGWDYVEIGFPTGE